MWPAAGSSPPPERTQPTPSASHSLCGGVDLTLKAEVFMPTTPPSAQCCHPLPPVPHSTEESPYATLWDVYI